MAHCNLGDIVMMAIGEGLQQNTVLQSLNVKGNHISKDGLSEFYQACKLNKEMSLKILDISSNEIDDAGGVQFSQALKQLHCLEQLNIKDNLLGTDSSDAFLFLVKEKRNLWKCNLDMNMIKYANLIEIERTCKKNKPVAKK